jgi:hypothetical protein
MSEEVKTVTAAGWKKAAVHNIMLPSGVRVDFKVPDLPALIEAGQIPQSLIEAALDTLSGSDERPTPEMIAQQREFTDRLVQIAVVNPKLSDEDVKDVPYEDKEMLVELATRQRDMDAEYKTLGGLEKSENFRRFRRLAVLDEDVEGS